MVSAMNLGVDMGSRDCDTRWGYIALIYTALLAYESYMTGFVIHGK